MSKFIAGLLTLLVPIFGLFIGRLIVGDFGSHAWTYIPIFWIPPFSLVPAIMMWTGAIGKKEEEEESTPPPAGVQTFCGGSDCGRRGADGWTVRCPRRY